MLKSCLLVKTNARCCEMGSMKAIGKPADWRAGNAAMDLLKFGNQFVHRCQEFVAAGMWKIVDQRR